MMAASREKKAKARKLVRPQRKRIFLMRKIV
jgi:hypothetical protein